MFLLSGEMGEFLGAFKTEELASHAAWEYSERDGSHKEQTIAYMEENTSIDHIDHVHSWAVEKMRMTPISYHPHFCLDDTEEYAIKNYKQSHIDKKIDRDFWEGQEWTAEQKEALIKLKKENGELRI